jgi:acyl-CoA reductase-like NAD-dependent aldehyde dehydrogenase
VEMVRDVLAVVAFILIQAISSADDSKGYFVQPTVILTKDPKSVTMREEIFGPVVTVRLVQVGLSPSAC